MDREQFDKFLAFQQQIDAKQKRKRQLMLVSLSNKTESPEASLVTKTWLLERKKRRRNNS